MEDEVTRLLAERKTARARQLIRERDRGARSGRRVAGLLVGLLFAVVVVTGAVVYAMRSFGVMALDSVTPILDPLVSALALLVLSPPALAIVGVMVLLVGLPFAKKFPRPGRFRNGVIALALAIGTFWPLQYLASRVDVQFWEVRMALHLLAGFLSLCLLTGAVESMRMASNTLRDDSFEFLN